MIRFGRRTGSKDALDWVSDCVPNCPLLAIGPAGGSSDVVGEGVRISEGSCPHDTRRLTRVGPRIDSTWRPTWRLIASGRYMPTRRHWRFASGLGMLGEWRTGSMDRRDFDWSQLAWRASPVVLAAIGVIVVIRRDADPAVPATQPQGSPTATLEDRVVSATDAVRLRTLVEPVIVRNEPRGLRVTDTDLARKLLFDTDDVVIAISGVPATHQGAIAEALHGLVSKGGDTLYVDLAHGADRRVVRWRINGYLPDALAAAGPAKFTIKLPAPDPITRINDFEYQIPRVVADQVVLDPAKTTGLGASLVSRDGKPFGFELSAIRTGSVYAKLGFKNGDIVFAVNGLEMISEQRAREIYAKLKAADQIAFDIERSGQRDRIVIYIQ